MEQVCKFFCICNVHISNVFSVILRGCDTRIDTKREDVCSDKETGIWKGTIVRFSKIKLFNFYYFHLYFRLASVIQTSVMMQANWNSNQFQFCFSLCFTTFWNKILWNSIQTSVDHVQAMLSVFHVLEIMFISWLFCL